MVAVWSKRARAGLVKAYKYIYKDFRCTKFLTSNAICSSGTLSRKIKML